MDFFSKRECFSVKKGGVTIIKRGSLFKTHEYHETNRSDVSGFDVFDCDSLEQ